MNIVSSVLASCPCVVWEKTIVLSTLICQSIAPALDLISPDCLVPTSCAERVIRDAVFSYLCTAVALIICRISLLTKPFYILLLVLGTTNLLVLGITNLILNKIDHYWPQKSNTQICEDDCKSSQAS